MYRRLQLIENVQNHFRGDDDRYELFGKLMTQSMALRRDIDQLFNDNIELQRQFKLVLFHDRDTDLNEINNKSINLNDDDNVNNNDNDNINSNVTKMELKVEDELVYLDQVKTEFAEKPHIYNDFLEIMKNFKAQSINTPGVIERVKNLFRGYNRLILGFNRFLPEECKIELTAEEEMLPHDHVPPTVTLEGGVSSTPVNPTAAAPASSATKPPPQLQQQQQQQQQHAISYVTTLRNRFANEPETYRSFLKILHTYQEHKGVKEVLEQVCSLFADHPDLLMEFTYFLPDAVQEQAKERLYRAVREAAVRRRYTDLNEIGSHIKSINLNDDDNVNNNDNTNSNDDDNVNDSGDNVSNNNSKNDCNSDDNDDDDDDDDDNEEQEPLSYDIRKSAIFSSLAQVPTNERRQLKVEDALVYLDRVKSAYCNEPHVFNEFIQIMQNFKSQSINTTDVIVRVKDLLRGNNSLIQGFNQFLPDGIKIEDSESDTSNQPTTQQSLNFPLSDSESRQYAISYITKVRNECQPSICKQFLKLLNDFQAGVTKWNIVIEGIAEIFKDHPELIMEFVYFFPNSVKAKATHMIREKLKLRNAQKQEEVST